MLAVCEGGSDAAALLVVALVIAAWAWVTVLVIKAAPERRERKALIALTILSSLLGPVTLLGLFDGFNGDNDRLPEIVVALLLPGLLGACVAVGVQAAHAARAFFLALWGAVFFIGAYAVLVISLLAIGSACLS